MEVGALPAAFPVLAHHLSFDERLTLGFNLHLAQKLEMGAIRVLGRNDGRALGMVGTVAAVPLEAWMQRLAVEFGSVEAATKRSMGPANARGYAPE